MARISTYPLDAEVVGTDKWVGSDSLNNFATKNFTADAVVDFINTDNRIESTSLRYKYVNYTSILGRKAGTITFQAGQPDDVYFDDVTSFMISKYQWRKYNSLVDFYSSPLIGSIVMISQCDDISNWGTFKWIDSTVDGTDLDFNNISLQYLNGPGYLKNNKQYFISILEYDASTSDKNYLWNQTSDSTQWIVNHGLNKYCSVSITDNNKQEVYANVVYDSLNTVTLTFSRAISGFAFFN